jgi:L-lactate dehydrogenase complex protein LldG
VSDAGARAEVMARIRTALGPSPAAVAVPRAYAVGSDLGRDDVLRRFAERVADHRATITRTDDAGLPRVVAGLLAGARRVVVPADLERSWLPGGVELLPDSASAPLAVDVLDVADAVVTAAAVGIAETGTVVLDGGPGQGRRATTLVPDVHVLVVRADQVVATVPEAVRRLEATRPQTWISGPSATSDIELSRVEGVHGPRTLHVVLVEVAMGMP